MQAAWRLATSNLSARRSRTALLVAAVTLSAALIAAVACALESANGAIRQQLEGQIGSAELRIRPANAGGVFPIGVMEIAESWPETDFAVPRARDAISVRVPLTVLEPDGDNGSISRLTVKREPKTCRRTMNAAAASVTPRCAERHERGEGEGNLNTPMEVSGGQARIPAAA